MRAHRYVEENSSWLPCWPPRRQHLSHQRWTSEECVCQVRIRLPTESGLETQKRRYQKRISASPRPSIFCFNSELWEPFRCDVPLYSTCCIRSYGAFPLPNSDSYADSCRINKGSTGTNSDDDSYAELLKKLLEFHFIGIHISVEMGAVAIGIGIGISVGSVETVISIGTTISIGIGIGIGIGVG